MRTKTLLVGLVIAVGACILAGTTLAAKLQWSTWVTYIVIGLDGLLLADVPYQFSRFYSSMKLRQGAFSQYADPPGLFISFGLMPVLVFIWLVWQFLS